MAESKDIDDENGILRTEREQSLLVVLRKLYKVLKAKDVETECVGDRCDDSVKQRIFGCNARNCGG